jgi:hypothetical protein
MPLDLRTHTTLQDGGQIRLTGTQREAFGPGVSYRKARDNGT